jgi:YfiH family protein
MNKTLELPLPKLVWTSFAQLAVLTDVELHTNTGIRIAFSNRQGGTSTEPFDSLNVSTYVGDDPAHVAKNRACFLDALGVESYPVITPHQVHGSDIVVCERNTKGAPEKAQEKALLGGDAVIIETPFVGAMLSFADCVPIIIVSPSGYFAVVHAGWRGVENEFVFSVVKLMAEKEKEAKLSFCAKDYNAYIGPHIKDCCFEVGEGVYTRFENLFGSAVCMPLNPAHKESAARAKGEEGGTLKDKAHPKGCLDLSAALKLSLMRAGFTESRIVQSELCTACNPDKFFSYRASGPVCGRQSAFALRTR